jgi:hypothetical protein
MNRTKKKIYAEELKEIKKKLEKRFDCKITSNKDEASIKAIANVLDTLGIKDKEEFMKNVAITIYKTIYLPFEFGCLTIDPLRQLELVAHELEHVLQWEKDPLAFGINYLTKPEKRAEMETKAMGANMEWVWRTTGKLYDIKLLAKHLVWYKVKSKDIKVAEKHLAILANILKQGGNYSIPVEAIMQLI